jgi:hypothetical protein
MHQGMRWTSNGHSVSSTCDLIDDMRISFEDQRQWSGPECLSEQLGFSSPIPGPLSGMVDICNMDDQWMVGGSSFDPKDAFDSFWIGRIGTKAVDSLCWQSDNASRTQDEHRLRYICADLL